MSCGLWQVPQVETPTALPETGGLAQTICLVDDFKPILAGVRIEVDDIGAERLPGAEGKDTAIEAADHLRQLDAGGLQMTLHADVHLQRGREPRRIHDSGPKLFGSCRRCDARPA